MPNSRLLRILECPICCELFRQPRVLPCQHTYCLDCLEKCSVVVKHEEEEDETAPSVLLLRCPVCQREFRTPDEGGFKNVFSRSFMADSLLELLKTCDYCETHPDKFIQAYCERCQAPTCIQCHMVGERHAGHGFTDVETKAAEARSAIGEIDDRLLRLSGDAAAIAEGLDVKLGALNATLSAVETEIVRIRDEVKAAADRHADRLLRKLDSVRVEKTAERRAVDGRFREHLALIDECRRFAEEAVVGATPSGLLVSHDLLLERERKLNEAEMEEWLKELRLVDATLVPAHLHPYLQDSRSLIGRLVVVEQTNEGRQIHVNVDSLFSIGKQGRHWGGATGGVPPRR